jgi:Na+-transporting NADH:ubiquinone oxidoreductase subunit NqrD
MGLIILPLAGIALAMGVGVSTLAAFFMGFATIIVTSMSAFIAFLLMLL